MSHIGEAALQWTPNGRIASAAAGWAAPRPGHLQHLSCQRGPRSVPTPGRWGLKHHLPRENRPHPPKKRFYNNISNYGFEYRFLFQLVICIVFPLRSRVGLGGLRVMQKQDLVFFYIAPQNDRNVFPGWCKYVQMIFSILILSPYFPAAQLVYLFYSFLGVPQKSS